MKQSWVTDKQIITRIVNQRRVSSQTRFDGWCQLLPICVRFAG
jgi:hypothetical protein